MTDLHIKEGNYDFIENPSDQNCQKLHMDYIQILSVQNVVLENDFKLLFLYQLRSFNEDNDVDTLVQFNNNSKTHLIQEHENNEHLSYEAFLTESSMEDFWRCIEDFSCGHIKSMWLNKKLEEKLPESIKVAGMKKI